MVTKDNVHQYLQLLTKALIVDRFKEVMSDFRKGFEEIFPLKTVTKWIRAEEFWALTIGIKELTP